MGSFSLWHLAIILFIVGAIGFLITVVVRSGRKVTYIFKPIAGLTKWLTAFVVLTMALGFLAWGLYLLELSVLADLQSGVTQELIVAFDKNAERLTTLGQFMILPVIVAAILGLWWIHRASANLWARNGEELSFSPGGAIGFYFVPILSLFLPFQALKEICIQSTKGADNKPRVSSGLLGAWWFLFIASSVARLVKNSLNRSSETIDGILFANYAAQIELALLMPLCIVFLIIVRRVTNLQSVAIDHSSSR